MTSHESGYSRERQTPEPSASLSYMATSTDGSDDTEAQDDVMLIVDGEEHTCSRSQLSSHSDYFKAMFSSRMRESASGVITLSSVKGHIIKVILKHIKTHSTCKISEHGHMIDDITRAAAMFQMPNLLDQCEEYLTEILSPQNCLSMCSLAESCGLNEIYNKAKHCSLWNFNNVISSGEFRQLDHVAVTRYLQEDHLNVESEMDLLSGIRTWIESDLESRLQYLSELLSVIHQSLLTQEDMLKLSDDPLVQKISKNPSEIGDLCKQKGPIRKPSHRLVVVGGLVTQQAVGQPRGPDSQDCNQKVFMYNEDLACWEVLTELPKAAIGARACVVDRFLYVGGGSQNLSGRSEDDIFCYDPLTDKWTCIATMDQPRRHYAMCSHGLDIYFIGGIGRFRIKLNTVSKLNITSGNWTNLPNTPQPVFNAAATVCQENLYVIKDSIQRLSLDTNTWTVIQASIPFTIGIASAWCLNDCVYLTGQHISYLYKLDLETMTTQEVCCFKEVGGPSCIIGHKVYIVDGERAEHGALMYHLLTKEKVKLSSLPLSLADYRVLALPRYPVFKPGKIS